jgi:hypothetical protein
VQVVVIQFDAAQREDTVLLLAQVCHKQQNGILTANFKILQRISSVYHLTRAIQQSKNTQQFSNPSILAARMA